MSSEYLQTFWKNLEKSWCNKLKYYKKSHGAKKWGITQDFCMCSSSWTMCIHPDAENCDKLHADTLQSPFKQAISLSDVCKFLQFFLCALYFTHFTATLALYLGVIDHPPSPDLIGCGWIGAQPTCSVVLSLMWLAEDDGSPPVTSTSSSNQQPAMEIDCSNLLSLLLWY